MSAQNTEQNKIKDNETYMAMDPKEHILALPDTYIGGIEPSTIENAWVCNINSEFINKDIVVSLGFHNIFNEILTNASDQCLRTREYEKKDKTVQITKTIKVTINKETGIISVYNDGDGIPVIEHTDKKIMVPELVFGQLLTSSNYDKEKKKTWGGRNGLGSKACNIYSTMFEVETVDHRRCKKFKQVWRNNMSEPDKKAKISDFKGKAYTLITFLPEYSRFGMPNGLNDAIIDLIRKRVYDIAGCSPKDVTVYFNDSKIEVKDFSQYVDKYIGTDKDITKVYEKPNESWEVVACVSPDGNFRQVSLVNGLCTINGGKHVDYISNKICKDLVIKLNGKAKTGGIKTNHIKNNLWVFINSFIVNPSFSSQTKESLSTPSNKFGSTCELSDTFINKLAKTEIAERAKLMKSFHDKSGLTKTDGKKTINIRGIPKLDDANWAGSNKSSECTLILTEGDSAKALIISGLSVVGRDKYGVFPLRGKLLNVRDASDKQITGNAELQNLKKILGLQQNTTKISDLRYGKVLIITDQDSVLGDTPLLLKENNGIIHIKTIDDLTTDWKMDINGKEYGNSNYQVWTDAGWTSIKHVMRHKVTKKIFRVLTHTGIVDVTEDHSLLNKNKEKISPKNCEVNQELLHHFPSFIENKIDIPDELNNLKVRELWKYASKINIQYYQKKSKDKLIKELTFYKNKNNIHLSLNTDYQITAEEAYVIGLWWADGTSGTYKWVYNHKRADRPKAYDFNRTTYNWNITNTNLDFLNKAKIIIEKYYDLEFKIIEDRHGHDTYGHKIIYKLIINGGIKTKDIVDKYSTLFYDNARNKRIPPEILNSNINVREQFFQGYYDGDGCKYSLERSGSMFFDINGKIGAQGLFFLCRSLGYEVSININPNKPKIYVLTITKGKQQDNPIRIKKIIDLGITEQYVYDLETDNHHFQAGVGQLIVHNTDGSHIKGLLMNMFEHYWENLLKDGFLVTMYTPIIKVRKGKKVVKVFYNKNDYEQWKDLNPLKGLTVKYYKGLGTSNKEEAKEYFKDLNIVDYTWCENSKKSIDLAFNKDKADKRKKWLSFYDKNDVINPFDKKITFKDFVNKDLIHFSNYDNHRSIPSIDGFKPSQRKAIYTFLKKNITSELKVAQVTGLITAETSYHHGETSMEGTIIGMAQNYVGSNNINLLYPSGQFGCIDPNTPVLLWNSTIKKAKDIQVGDQLIGDDGTPRNVQKITSGIDEMYEVIADNMDNYTVNKNHILTLSFSCHKVIYYNEFDTLLKMDFYCDKNKTIKTRIFNFKKNNGKRFDKLKLDRVEAYQKMLKFSDTISNNNIFDMNIQDYLKLPQYIKNKIKGIINKSVIRWKYQHIDIDPYILGLLLGNVVTGYDILTSNNDELSQYLINWLNSHNFINLNQIEELFKDSYLPIEYIVNSEENRLQLLAGIIDIMGTLKENYYYVIEQHVRNKNLIESFRIIAGSLGYRTKVYESFNDILELNISGNNLKKIPLRLKRKQITLDIYNNDYMCNDIYVKYIGKGEFCGWNIDGNERFLLSDFTITHNTRLVGGNDAAQSRYIFTNLEKITKLIFRKEDEPLLTNQVDEGSIIEPKFYMPIIPMILVNGAHGIGTGFSTHVPCFNPKDIILNIKLLLENKNIIPLSPWYRKFKGKILQNNEKDCQKWYTEGNWEFKTPTTLEITELPIGLWTDDYHHYLEDLIIDNSEKDPKKKKKQCITSYKKCNDHDDENIHLILSFNKTTLSELKKDQDKLKTLLKLRESKSCSVTNLHLFDPLGEIVKFNSPDSILRSYYKIRLYYYKKRREYQIKFLQREIKYLSAKIRFINGIINETITISKRSNNDILVELRDKQLLPPDPLNEDIIISPINEEVYKNALDGEVTRYCYNIESSSDDSSSESNDDSSSESNDDSSSESNDDSSSESNDDSSSESKDDSSSESKDDSSSESKDDSSSESKDDKSILSCDKKPEIREVKKILTEDYGYLLTMHIWSLTEEKIKELEVICNKKEGDLSYMQKITPKDLWKLDINELEKEL